MKRTTVLDVAKAAGVSQGTVSRVLTGKNWVSDDMRIRVEAAVRSLGYVPNALAQSLKAQRSRTVGALVSDISNPLHGVFLAAAEEALRPAGYMLLVASTYSRVDQELALLALFRGRVDGLLIAQIDETNKQTQEALRAAGLPIVFHDREAMGMGDTVIVDHRAGALAATHHLLALHHRRIAVVSTPSLIRPGRERIEGYRRALQKAGIAYDPALVCELGASSELSFSEVKSLLELPDPPTAIICLGTRLLAGVLEAVASAGLSVPGQISIVGVGDTDLLRLHTPPITSVRWDVSQCGRLAAEMLLDRMESTTGSPSSPPRARHVPVEFVIRQSTAPLRRVETEGAAIGAPQPARTKRKPARRTRT